MNLDPVEKKPLYHFLPGTSTFSLAIAGCNFSCLNCQNHSISQVSPIETGNYELSPASAVAKAESAGALSISYTYSEPVVFVEYMLETASLAKEKGIRNILVSNGFVMPEPLSDLCTVIDAANIDLKSIDEEFYKKVCGGSLKPVLNSLKTLKDSGVWLEITTLIIPGLNDNTETLKKLCGWLADQGFSDNPLHFSRFHPVHQLSQKSYTPSDSLELARKLATEAGIRYVYLGNVQGEDYSSTVCPDCKKTLISRNGFRITQNTMENGCCPYCSAKIDGVWK
jgi:pyruvate formate lyase activating enzyme